MRKVIRVNSRQGGEGLRRVRRVVRRVRRLMRAGMVSGRFRRGLEG